MGRPVSAGPGDVAAAVRQLTAAVAELVARVEALEGARLATVRPDAAADAALLSAIAHALGGSVFTAHDLARLAAHDPELHRLLGKTTVRAVAFRLRRLHRRTTGPHSLRLVMLMRLEAGRVWAVTVDAAQQTGSARGSPVT